MSKLDLMLSDEIKAGLGTRILGREVISYAQISSTNNVALELAAGGTQEGTLVTAEYQTFGRGRRKRKWLSPARTSILASLILRPSIMLHEAQSIVLISAVAVAHAIRNVTQLPALIKWPNDVMVNDRKVSGILAEMRTEGSMVKFIVLGIGVTVNLPRSRFPKEIMDVATSLSHELGHGVSRIALLQEILRQLEQRYVKIKEHKIDNIIAEWKALSATIGRQVRITLPRRIINGHALDIDESGALLVRVSTGEIQRIMADDAVQLRVMQD